MATGTGQGVPQDEANQHIPPSLPEELLSLIFSHVSPVRCTADDPEEDFSFAVARKTLLSALKASKTFYRSARFHLYRAIVLESYGTGHRKLLLTLLKDPKVAEGVRQIRIIERPWHNELPNGKVKKAVLAAELKEAGHLAFKRLQALRLAPPTAGHIFNGVREQTKGAEFACIVAICQYVEVIELPDRRLGLLPMLVKCILSPRYGPPSPEAPPPLCRLKALALKTPGEDFVEQNSNRTQTRSWM